MFTGVSGGTDRTCESIRDYREIFMRLAMWLKSIGVDDVIESACANDIVMLESAEELLYR